MAWKRIAIGFAVVVAVVGITYYAVVSSRSNVLVLTGIVTTNPVVVSPQVGGQIEQLPVGQGQAVKENELLAVLSPTELQAQTSYYAHSAASISSQVRETEAELRQQKEQTAAQIRQAEANLAAAQAEQTEAEANLRNAKSTLDRDRGLARDGVITPQQLDQATTAYEADAAHVEALRKQVAAQQAALSLARANAAQIAVRESQMHATEQQLAAAAAQEKQAIVRLGYTQLRAPVAGIVDVRAVEPGEVVVAGQPVMTIINPDDLWVRADIPETYIDRVRLGERLTVRLPSGAERVGTVFYRAVDASFATERNVGRTKRDIKAFEIRLRVNNGDRALAAGMTAYVLFPLS